MVEKNVLSSEGVIEIKEIHKTFQNTDGTHLEALNDIHLTVEAGEFVSLIGPSGCGKSTLLRLIAGLDQANQGQILLDSTPISGPHYLRGLVFQDPTLFPWLTVEKNIAAGLVARKVYEQQKHEIGELIDMIGLEGFEKSYPHQLSGGMAQRVAIARALVNHPRVLLLDEPFGALDAFTRMHMQDEILRIWSTRKTTMVLVTHDVDESIYLSDRIVVMSPRPGKIQEIIPVPIGRPRARNHPDFFRIRSRILEILHFAESPAGEAGFSI